MGSPPPDGPGLSRLVGLLRTGAAPPEWQGRTLADGTRVGRLIGLGGMCAVFEGDAPDRRPCAVKILLPEHAGHLGLRRRFDREARILLARGIPGLPRGLAIGEQDGLPWLAMERVTGRTLADRLGEEGRLDARTAVDVLRQVLEVLDRVHRHGIVHRDLKPENVLLRENGSVCLLDLGIARLERRPEDGITRPGEFLGTPPYAAPEQIDDARSACRESDLFAAGVLLLEMLTGRTLAERPRAARARQARALLELEGCAPPIERVVERALSERPARRFHRARAMARALTSPSLAALTGWVLDRPAAVLGFEMLCVGLVLGTLLVRAWDLEERLAAERARYAADAERLAAENRGLREENARLRDQRDGPIRLLLFEEVRDRYRALVGLDRDAGRRELPRFLAACAGFLAQSGEPELRAAVEAMRTAIAWRATARPALLRIPRGRFADSWGDVPDTRVRVLLEGREVAASARFDDRREPEYALEVPLTLGPFDALTVVVEEHDVEWEVLLRLDSGTAPRRIDPVESLGTLARSAPLEVDVRWRDPAPPLPETE